MESPKRLIPREAYSYWPDESIHGHGRFAQRALFKRQVYTEQEEAALRDLDDILDQNLSLRQKLRDILDRADLLRFLYATEWDLKSVVERLRQYVEWYEGGLTVARTCDLQDIKSVLVPVT